ncbi:hypothetical protein QJQ45_023431 [Haematococcus lacustris]|nr:hypothetical protein QJQ45_023431 [Haematococcus lacustris]
MLSSFQSIQSMAARTLASIINRRPCASFLAPSLAQPAFCHTVLRCTASPGSALPASPDPHHTSPAAPELPDAVQAPAARTRRSKKTSALYPGNPVNGSTPGLAITGSSKPDDSDKPTTGSQPPQLHHLDQQVGSPAAPATPTDSPPKPRRKARAQSRAAEGPHDAASPPDPTAAEPPAAAEQASSQGQGSEDGGAAVAKPRTRRKAASTPLPPTSTPTPTPPTPTTPTTTTPTSTTPTTTTTSTTTPTTRGASRRKAASATTSTPPPLPPPTTSTAPEATASSSPRSRKRSLASPPAAPLPSPPPLTLPPTPPATTPSPPSAPGRGIEAEPLQPEAAVGLAALHQGQVPPPGSKAWTTRLWVVFSDLHVSVRTLPTCLQVLRRVRAEAKARGAGVLFLGDFWDEGSSLPVEPLNAVLAELQHWEADGFPVLGLVGNHDQVSLGGESHALGPLAASLDSMSVFSAPALFRGALWLPYRREEHKLREAVAAALLLCPPKAPSTSTSTPDSGLHGAPQGLDGKQLPPLAAVFAHADVATARMNALWQARHGLPPDLFPEGIPVYSGHYHLPHTVPGTTIMYVGSQYQVNHGEAGERKRLLVLDAEQGWRVVEEVPVDIGRRHYKLHGSALLEPSMGSEGVEEVEEIEGADGAEGAEGAEPLPQGALHPELRDLRRGDVVRQALGMPLGAGWRLPLEALGSEQYKAVQEQLRAQGVVVEAQALPSSRAAPRLVVQEEAAPSLLLEQYAALAGMGQGPLALAQQAVQTYTLADKGLRALTGRNEDDGGASSNGGQAACGTWGEGHGNQGLGEEHGAGKSSLVSAPLWALTGTMLSRFESGGGRAGGNIDSMLNDDSKEGRVEVWGELDGQAFRVTRVVKTGKTSKLTLQLGGEDLTRIKIPDTQV